MFFPRPHGRVACFLPLSATAFLCFLIGPTAGAKAQEVPAPSNIPPSSQPSVQGAVPAQNSTPPSMPASVQVPQSVRPAMPPYAPESPKPHRDSLGSAYIPVDSIVYPMALRLYSMGFLDTAFINMRPWTRRSLLHMLEQSSPSIIASGNDQAIDILAKLDYYLAAEGAEDTTTELHVERGMSTASSSFIRGSRASAVRHCETAITSGRPSHKTTVGHTTRAQQYYRLCGTQ